MKFEIIALVILLFGTQTMISGTVANKEGYIIMDMVHHNPGEPMTESAFRNPEKLASFGFNGMVINEFKFPHCAVSFETFDKRIFPKRSKERVWIENLTKEINRQVNDCHENGLNAYFFTDIIVLPQKLVELYKDEICDEEGRISFEREKTWEIHRIMLKELFERFPAMDGLVIRTGETYLHNIPYHTGNGPVDYSNKYEESIEIHTKLMRLLREEVCVKRNKKIIYRTWDFGYFHTRPEYYSAVTESVEPHPNLYISIKHTQGDYFRTFGFNKTITIGHHKQVIEVQCQREYEGKGAYPNYVANAVINGFEETKNDSVPRCLNDIKNHPLFSGIWTWSRGGGWEGPYISNEFWCDINTYVMSQWANNPNKPEEAIFNEYAIKSGITEHSLPYFRKLCLLTSDGIIRGRGSLIHNVNVGWTRDHFLGGVDQNEKIFNEIIAENKIMESIYEKKVAVAIWKDIVELSEKIECSDKKTEEYIRISAKYGYFLHAIIEQGWIIMLKGYQGDKTGEYDLPSIAWAIEKYDKYWSEYKNLKENNPVCATLYLDNYLYWKKDDNSRIYYSDGLGASVEKYRKLVNKSTIEKLALQKVGEYDVYLLIGQSNMAGRGFMLPEDSIYMMDGVWLLNNEDVPEPAKNPMNRYSTVRKSLNQQHISPATMFGQTVANRTGRKILIVMNALGGSSIDKWAKDAALIDDKGSIANSSLQLYNEAIRRAKEAQKYGTLRGILWHQGEADINRASLYPMQLSQLVADLRADLNMPEIPFVAGELAYWYGEDKASINFNKMIRTIQDFIPNGDWISAEGANMLSNEKDPHFGRDGQLLLGERYAEKILKLVYGIEK